MKATQIHLCFVGNMLGRNPNFVTTQGQILADLLKSDGYLITCVSSKINRLVRFIDIFVTLSTKYRQFNIVILEVYSGMYFMVTFMVGVLCKLLKIPLIMVLHGGNLPGFVQKYPRLSKLTFGMADSIVAPSTYLSEVAETWGFNVKVIPNVVDLSLYPYFERTEILPRIMWMRSFHEIYNPEMAVRVLAELRKSVPSASLTMSGNDKGLEKQVRALAAELGQSEAIRFTGFLDMQGKVEEFSNHDIYINTNRIDNMPVSVLEARAMGLAVVATDVGGLPHLITHMENGLLSPDDDVESMVKNIKLLIANDQLAQRIARNGRALAELSSWTAVYREWETLFFENCKAQTLKSKAA